MKALITMHVEHEGPGTIGEYLAEVKAEVKTVRLYLGEPLPSDPREADLIISMGGPMNVYEDEKHSFLADEAGFIARAVEAGVPVVGICLGAQLIARAFGARVYKTPVKEIGWQSVSITEEGRRDVLLRNFSETIPVLQWHEDTFDLPAGAQLLATAPECRHQAFRIGSAYGLQFHVEVDGKMLADWFAETPRKSEILKTFDMIRRKFNKRARVLYGNLVGQAGNVSGEWKVKLTPGQGRVV